MTTGHYPARHRITSYLAHREKNEERGMAQWLDVDAATLPRMLAQQGYATGHFGKWHMGGQRDVGEAPLITEYGFDASLTNFEGLGHRVLPLCDAYDGSPVRRHDLGSASLGRGPIEWEDRSKITERFVTRAVKFIDQAAEEGKPFYINVWPDDVHSPFFPPAARRGDEAKRTLYHGVLETMDEQLSELFDRVRGDERLRDNTLILLASDNGHEIGAGSGGPLRGSKGFLYEGGIRSPLIVWAPGLMHERAVGTVNETTIASSVDLVASLINLCGGETPEGYQADGEDLSAALLGLSSAQRSGPLFWRRPPDRPGSRKNPNPDLAIRDGPWKLLCNLDGSATQLYHLERDIGEQNDVADQHPRIVRRLKRELLAWNQTLPRDGVDRRQQIGALPAGKFVNPIAEGADPSVVRDGERYLWCQSEGNRGIAIWQSDRLHRMGEKHVVWKAPESGPVSKEVWAPELLKLDDRWYIYFAASDGQNRNHRSYVLRSKTSDPLGEYDLHGPLYTGDDFETRKNNRWAIDMTVLQHGDKRYAIWSGWPDEETDLQYLYAAPMKSPVEIGGARVRICDNDDFLWERTEEREGTRGLHEAPQILQRAEHTFVVYSCGASWLPTYKLGLLELVGNDPTDPAAWKKHPEPVFTGTSRTYGVGHGNFVRSPDGSQWWHVYHAKRDREPGWRRAIFVQPMQWSKAGQPLLGRPVDPGLPLNLPAGSPVESQKSARQWDFRDPATRQQLDYFGHHQLVEPLEQGVALGTGTSDAVNLYRSGEKLMVRDTDFDDVEVEARFRFLAGERDAGILFRVTGPSIGYDAQRGYFAGIVPRTGRVILGKMDGRNWHHLGHADIDLSLDDWQQLRVDAVGDRIRVYVGDSEQAAIDVRDADYPRGAVGVRVVNTAAVFQSLEANPK